MVHYGAVSRFLVPLGLCILLWETKPTNGVFDEAKCNETRKLLQQKVRFIFPFGAHLYFLLDEKRSTNLSTTLVLTSMAIKVPLRAVSAADKRINLRSGTVLQNWTANWAGMEQLAAKWQAKGHIWQVFTLKTSEKQEYLVVVGNDGQGNRAKCQIKLLGKSKPFHDQGGVQEEPLGAFLGPDSLVMPMWDKGHRQSTITSLRNGKWSFLVQGMTNAGQYSIKIITKDMYLVLSGQHQPESELMGFFSTVKEKQKFLLYDTRGLVAGFSYNNSVFIMAPDKDVVNVWPDEVFVSFMKPIKGKEKYNYENVTWTQFFDCGTTAIVSTDKDEPTDEENTKKEDEENTKKEDESGSGWLWVVIIILILFVVLIGAYFFFAGSCGDGGGGSGNRSKTKDSQHRPRSRSKPSRSRAAMRKRSSSSTAMNVAKLKSSLATESSTTATPVRSGPVEPTTSSATSPSSTNISSPSSSATGVTKNIKTRSKSRSHSRSKDRSRNRNKHSAGPKSPMGNVKRRSSDASKIKSKPTSKG